MSPPAATVAESLVFRSWDFLRKGVLLNIPTWGVFAVAHLALSVDRALTTLEPS